MDNLSKKSAWNRQQLKKFLDSSKIPIRVSVLDGEYPLICSVWFEYLDGKLIIVSHQESKLAKTLVRQKKCGFEIASNDPPYRGVRGKADVVSELGTSEEILRRVIQRYLGETNQRLASWLLSRVKHEMKFTLHPKWVTSWDYGERMEKAQS
tara:strand:- start:99 stop:554 length:456 start_codon:yes stop_codon:yes gene_type:complete